VRKIILNVAVTLDGYIEGSKGEYDWCFTDQDYGMEAFLDRTDAIFLGRKSYELLLATEPGAFPGKKKYVFSSTLKEVADDYLLVRGNIVEEAKHIAAATGKDIWLFGGAMLITAFVNAGLVDEFQLSIHPLLLGSGKLLFQQLSHAVPLKLVNCRQYETGLVQLFYTRSD
jgi:dihydrofolate reductase